MTTSFTDPVAGRVATHVLQGRTDAAGVEQTGAHVDGKDVSLANEELTGGVLNPAAGYQVLATSPTPDMFVHVGSGVVGDVAIVEGSEPQQGNYAVSWPDADTSIQVPASDLSDDRIDEVYLVVLHDQFDTSGLSLPRLAYRDGTPASTPEAPGPDPNWTAFLKLAEVLVGAGVTEITDTDITDARLFAGVKLGDVERLSALLNGNTVLDAPAGGLITFRIDGNNEMLLGPNTLNLVDNDISGVGDIDASGNITVTGTVDGVDVSAHDHDGDAPQIQNGGLATGAVDDRVIATGAVGTGELAAGSVTTSVLDGGSVGSFITTRAATSNTAVNTTTGFQDIASVTFTKPSGWGTYEAIVWGSFETNGADRIRVRLGANHGAVTGIADVLTAEQIAIRGDASDRFTGISGSSNAVAVQGARTSGSGASMTRATVTAMFIRTS